MLLCSIFRLSRTSNRGFMSKTFWLSVISLLLVSCTNLPITFIHSKNYNQRINFLVMHYTAIDYEKSIEVLVDHGGLSAHYLIPERHDPSYANQDLSVIQLLDESDRAWHAGKSHWQGREQRARVRMHWPLIGRRVIG